MYLQIDGIRSGPFSTEDVSNRYASGELDRRAMSWCEGEGHWTTLGKRWPTPRPKPGRLLSAGMAIIAAAAALAIPTVLIAKLPLALQTGTVLWGSVIGCLVVVMACLYGTARGRRRPRKSLLSVLFGMVLVASGTVALALAGLNAPVLKVRQAAPNAIVSFHKSLNFVRVDGDIGPRLPGQFDHMLALHPGTAGIELNSPGGLVTDALQVAGTVNARGLSARVDGICASACVAIWAASPHHQMTATSRLGLHQIRFELDLPHQIIGRARDELKRKYDGFLRGAGLREEVIERKDRTRPSDVYWLDATQVANEGVALQIYDADGAPVSNSTAEWLWLESILGKNNAMRHLMVAIREHAAPLVPGHAEELYAAFRANDAEAAREAGRSLRDDAMQFALARASDQAVFDWAKSFRDMLERALSRHDAFACAVLTDRPHSAPQDRQQAVALADASVNSLARMIESLPPDLAGMPSAPDGARTQEIRQRTWRDALSKGYPADNRRWNVFQHCGYMADYYDNLLKLPAHQAAEVLRYAERSAGPRR